MKSYDSDLNPVLEKASNEELMPMVEYMLKKATNYIDIDERYKKRPENPRGYTDLIADELRLFGSNSFASILRGGVGVSYHEVVCDVASKLKVNYNKSSSCERIETEILQKVFTDAWNKLSEGERKTVIKEVAPGARLSGPIATMTAQEVMKLAGFTTYKLAVIVANAVAKSILGHGLTLAANAALTKSISVLIGPIGWVIAGLWALIDAAGPSYKTTIPCVIQVAVIRQNHR